MCVCVCVCVSVGTPASIKKCLMYNRVKSLYQMNAITEACALDKLQKS